MKRIRVKYTANGKFKLKISFSNQKTCRLKQSKKFVIDKIIIIKKEQLEGNVFGLRMH